MCVFCWCVQNINICIERTPHEKHIKKIEKKTKPKIIRQAYNYLGGDVVELIQSKYKYGDIRWTILRGRDSEKRVGTYVDFSQKFGDQIERRQTRAGWHGISVENIFRIWKMGHEKIKILPIFNLFIVSICELNKRMIPEGEKLGWSKGDG